MIYDYQSRFHLPRNPDSHNCMAETCTENTKNTPLYFDVLFNNLKKGTHVRTKMKFACYKE
jgi:hypothetical protein